MWQQQQQYPWGQDKPLGDFSQSSREGDRLGAALRDPVTGRILLYLAHERTAAAPKIGFDLKLSLGDLAKALAELQELGLVEEVRSAKRDTAQQKMVQMPSAQGTFILTARGIQAARRIGGDL